ncbi:MAG: fused MFS/spermidine synthase [Myxococcales bacterium]|nr:fused MFS/spermidine synthase [Myxococcales bacterium]
MKGDADEGGDGGDGAAVSPSLAEWLVPFVCFFLSGASSLVFEVIWTRKLTLVFGASTPAISTVLSAFMGGLALGSYVIGKRADRLKFPLLTYAVMEAFVGLFALAVPFIVDTVYPPIGRWISINAGNRFDVFTLLRFVVVALVLLPPTVLMGATLPLLTRHFVRRGGELGQRVGALYAVNTFGAVAGTLTAGFILLPGVGLRWTNAIAALTNVVLASLVFVFRKPLLDGKWPESWRDLLPSPAKLPEPTAAADEAAKRAEPAVSTDESAEKTQAEPSSVDDAPESKKRSKKNGKKRDKGARDETASTKATDANDREPERERTSDEPPEKQDKDVIDEPATRALRVATLIAAAGSGFAALSYEVILSRALDMVIGSSVYSFTIILSAFLVGIGGGSALAGAVLKAKPKITQAAAVAIAFVAVALLQLAVYGTRVSMMIFVATSIVATLGLAIAGTYRKPTLALGTVQLLIAVGAVCVYYFQDKIPQMFLYLAMVATDSCGRGSDLKFSNDIGTVQFVSFFTALATALPPTLGMGATFPLAVRAFARQGDEVGGDTGRVYSMNTIGSILGSFLTGFFIMPAVGLETAFYVAVAVNLAIALYLLLASPGEEPVKYVIVPVAAILLAIAATGVVIGREGRLARSHGRFTVFPKPWNQERMTLGVFRLSLADSMIRRENNQCFENRESDRERGLDDGNPIYYRDGVTTTVTVERWTTGTTSHLALKNNGKVDASNGDDMPTQVLVGAIPLLAHPRGPQDLDVSIVGWGSGVTVGTVLQWPVRRVDVIELERATLDASRYFSSVNHLEYPLRDFPYVRAPRLTVINNDGRNFLATTPRKYDVVISEPSNPWITGVSNLFTVDHFRAASQSLAPDGIFVQWVQLYELSPDNIRTIYRTIAEVFPHVRVFSADAFSSDTVVLASFRPITLDVPRIQRFIDASERGRTALAPARIDRAEDLIARTLFGSREEVLRYAQYEERLEEGRWTRKMFSTNHDECPASTCRRVPAPLNTDDNARIEFAAPRDLIGYDAFAGYVETLYDDRWPYGRVIDDIVLSTEPVERARSLGRIATAMLANGRPDRVLNVLERATNVLGTRPAPPELERASDLWTALTTEREPALRLDSARAAPDLSAEGERELLAAFERATEQMRQGSFRTALSTLDGLPSQVRDHAGPSVRLLRGYLLYKVSLQPGAVQQFSQAAEYLERLAREELPWATQHTEVLFFIARARFHGGDFALAVAAMSRWIDLVAQAPAREHEREPLADDPERPEPPAQPLAITDEPGESDKDLRR